MSTAGDNSGSIVLVPIVHCDVMPAVYISHLLLRLGMIAKIMITIINYPLLEVGIGDNSIGLGVVNQLFLETSRSIFDFKKLILASGLFEWRLTIQIIYLYIRDCSSLIIT